MREACMRSVVIEGHGDPGDVLLLKERPVPEPGPGEVRLALILSPIHTHDLEIVQGEYGQQPALPMTPGTEAVGRVDALGAGVSHLQVGQRVCVAGASATWAEYFLARAGSVVPLPDEVSDEAACQLLAMPLSACMLLDELAMQPGDWMIQNAANGAVGRVVNALAAKRGLHVINLVRSGAAAAAMRQAGCPQVLSSDDPSWRTQVAQLTGGAALMRAVDSLGGDAPNELLSVLGVGGTLVSFGSMRSLTLNLHVDHLLYRHATVRGFWAARRSESLAAADRVRMIQEVIGLVVRGQLSLTLHATYDLADAAAAAGAVALRNRGGKIALRAFTSEFFNAAPP